MGRWQELSSACGKNWDPAAFEWARFKRFVRKVGTGIPQCKGTRHLSKGGVKKFGS